MIFILDDSLHLYCHFLYHCTCIDLIVSWYTEKPLCVLSKLGDLDVPVCLSKLGDLDVPVCFSKLGDLDVPVGLSKL